jgi:hypothetical protein
MTNEQRPEPTAVLDESALATASLNNAATASIISDSTTVFASNLETDRTNNDDAAASESAELNSQAAGTNSSRRTIDTETAAADATQTFETLALSDLTTMTTTTTTTTPVTHSETMLLGTIPEVLPPFGTEPLPAAARATNRPSPVTTTTTITPRGRVNGVNGGGGGGGGGAVSSLPRPYNLALGTASSPLEPAVSASTPNAGSGGGGFLTSPHSATSFAPLSATPTRCINSANGTYFFRLKTPLVWQSL